MEMDIDPLQLPPLCPLCDHLLYENEEPITVIKEKGLNTFIEKSKSYNDYKWQQWQNITTLTCHGACRRKYAKKPIFKTDMPSCSNTEVKAFDFKQFCLYCGLLCDADRRRHLMRYVQDKSLIERVINTAKHRENALATQILSRLDGITCLVNEGARYHIKCATSFFAIPKSERTLSSRSALIEASFNAVCEYIETSGKFEFTIKELQGQLKEYEIAHETLYKKLTEKYGTDIFIHHVRGKPAIVYYKHFDIGNLCKKFYSGENLQKPEKLAIFKVAAELLRKDIKNHEYKIDSYPQGAEFLKNVDDDVPESLMNFLGLLLENDHSGDADRYQIKSSCLAHSVIKCIRGSAFVSTLQLGLGTYIHRKTGSRQIVDLLNKTGVCSPYHHLVQYENSVVMHPPKMTIEKGVHVQHVFDYTDRNVRTLDGLETFHCLGGIAVYTPESDVAYDGRTARVTERNTATSIAVANKSAIKAIPYVYINATGLEAVEYIDISTLNLSSPPPLPPPYSVYLWAKSFRIANIPSWSGFMEGMSHDEIPLTSRVVCLPFINEPSSKPTTLNTALHYAQAEANKLNQKTCFVTFDQPLYQKARAIVAESQENGQLNNVVVRLGGFHLLMSYLGAVGYIMGGSGLDSLWSVVYAPASIKKMLNGHAYSRAMRAHILTFTALGVIISETIDNDKTEKYRNFLSSFLNKWQHENPEPPNIGECRLNMVIAEMTEEFVAQINSLKNNGPTAQLWLQYFQLIVIALQFVEAERLGNWKLHLQTVKEMLPVFHAAGHLSYAKSAQLYLQDMIQLEIKLVDDPGYELFSKEGYFTVRRSDKSWAGVWSDMTIEQTLNRYFGTDLKHGRGVTSGVVARDLLARPTVFSVMESVEEYFHMTSSEQHKDLGTTRLKRDNADLAKFLFWLKKHAPLDRRPNLVSLSTGIIGGSNINCHLAIQRGEELMQTMVGKNVKSISLSMTSRVKTLESVKTAVHIGGTSSIAVNLTQLFHRILVVFKDDEEKKKKAFEYELSPFPLALFDEKGFMRKTQKSELYKLFKRYQLPKSFRTLNEFLTNFVFVIDGRFLLHRVTWSHGSTYRDIFEKYRMDIIENFRSSACVVFDGYTNECIGIKSYERYRRRETNFAADVEISPDTLFTLSQRKFLSNTANKLKFVQLLSEYLKNSGIQVSVATEDADVLIVKTALKMDQLVTNSPVAIVGNDVDLLVLLIGLSNERQRIYYHKVVPTAKTTEIYLSADHDHLRQFVLFAHAFVGCDSTSALHSKGKETIIKLLEQNENLRESCKVFYYPYSTSDIIFNAAQEFISHLYGFANEKMTIGAARYRKYEASASLDTTTRLTSLPPTTGALREHANRVYLQIQTWLGNTLNPETWGWTRTESTLLPIMTKQSPAPEELLNMVFCGCVTDCVTAHCKCKKSGMTCSSLCENCNGTNCQNSRSVEIDRNFEEIDEDSDREAEKQNDEETDYFESTEIEYDSY